MNPTFVFWTQAKAIGGFGISLQHYASENSDKKGVIRPKLKIISQNMIGMMSMLKEEGMALMLRAQDILFSTTDNIHSTPITAKAQVVLELNNPIILWILHK